MNTMKKVNPQTITARGMTQQTHGAGFAPRKKSICATGSWLRLLALAAFLTILHSFAAAQYLADFGYNRMRVNGQEARGYRPLLLIIASYDGGAPFAHTAAEYDTLVFNYLKQSVNGHFLENSNGRFLWSRAGTVTVALSAADAFRGGDDILRSNRAIEEVMRRGFNFAQFDANANGRIEAQELGVLIIQNARQTGAGLPVNGYTRATGRLQTNNSWVALDALASNVEQQASLMTITHELAHQLGTLDLYSGECVCLNSDITLMGATVYQKQDDRRTYHLDPWHKMQLGWSEPRIFDLRYANSTYLPATQMIKADAPVILYDSQRGTGEFFIVEYRSQSARGGGYDKNVATEGLAIWHVQQDANKAPTIINNPRESAVFHAGAPSLTRGANQFWRGREITPYLRWLDGSMVRTNLFVDPFALGAEGITVRWSDGGKINDLPNGIYRLNSTTQRFESVPGALTQISVGADGETWGLNAANEIYWLNPATQLFEQVAGRLTQIAVGSSQHVWGLNSIGEIFQLNPVTRQFAQVSGRLVKIAISANGAVWGLNPADEIYRLNRAGTYFEQVPGRLMQIAVASNYVWGINAAGEVYRYNSTTGQFQQVPGYLTQIAVGLRFQPWGGYAEEVWGINAAHEIYRFNLQTQLFEQVPGRLARIAVGVDSVAGINDATEIYRFNTRTQQFVQVPGSLVRIAVGAGGTVWGLNALTP